ncbi:PPE family protein [Mycobacterium nebraskense]|uniref:PPE family protein n=1 Tax=Mycobacterium nebraskense TaxID=244292 RepID=UPI00061830A2|nr:PPE family protein [Mycobacterium nebraskense]KKC05796.1 PPE family protein [Mycobacterium nebraskense]
MDFGALPPEINSARMYAGPGAGSLLAAAAGWDGLVAELSAAAASYGAVVARLTAVSWHGPASASMAAAAAPYVAWMTTTAAQAEQAANQARAAAAVYEAAFAATVPPPVIAANRSLLMSLIATNLLGQNTPAIAATEAQYAEMWAQDATAMYGYAASSAAASTLPPFASPQQTTNPVGLAGQGAVVAQVTGSSTATNTQAVLTQLTSTVPTALQGLSSPLSSTSSSTVSSSMSPTLSQVGSMLSMTSSTAWITSAGLSSAEKLKNLLPSAIAATVAPAVAGGLGSGPVGLAGLGGGAAQVSAGMGSAGLVGSLSVPQAWTAAAPTGAATTLAGTSLGAVQAADAGGLGGMLGGLPIAGPAGRGVGAVVPDARFLERPAMVPPWSTVG